MNKLNHGCQCVTVRVGVPNGATHDEEQRWAQALATALNDVLRDLRYQRHIAVQAIAYDLVDQVHVGGNNSQWVGLIYEGVGLSQNKINCWR